jgi:alpha-beta hydrolase superfamily lysophospholipase
MDILDPDESSDCRGRSRSVKSFWFGDERRPLFGWLHVPSGDIRGGVLLSPTLGLEEVSARYAYRRLADQLADAGFVTMRFDYDGTGDSVGWQDDPGRVAAWLEGIGTALTVLQGMQLGRISLIGMRMGATLACQYLGSGADTVHVDDLVLWDPCESGRSFLRAQSTLSALSTGPESSTSGGIETPGLVYDSQTVADLSELSIATSQGPLADGVLLLMRSNRKGNRAMLERLTMPHVERLPIEGQEDLVDVEPHYALLPTETMHTIADWLAGRATEFRANTVALAGIGRDSGIVGSTPSGLPIAEHAVALGTGGMFGLVTEAVDAGPVESGSTLSSFVGEQGQKSTVKPKPTVVFLNAGALDHVGPARLWVQLSRAWAAAGFRCVRFDLVGLGDSSVATGEVADYVYAPTVVEDVVQVLREVSPGDPSNVVLVGLCSGGYHAIEVGIASKVRSVCAVNPCLTFRPPEVNQDAAPELQTGKLDARRQASGAKKDWTRLLPGRDQLGPIVDNLPDPLWWIINRVAVQSPPARSLSRLVDTSADVQVICGQNEAHLLLRGEARMFKRLRRTGRFEMVVIRDLEHSLFERSGRERTSDLLTEHVVGRIGGTPNRQ